MKSILTKTAAAAILLALAGAAAIGYVRARRNDPVQAPPADLLAHLPGSAPILIYVDLAALRQSGFYRHRHAPLMNAAPEGDYKSFVQATGFDFETDLDRLAIAAWPDSKAGPQNKAVAIAKGRFDRPRIRAYAQGAGKIEQQAGREVLVFPANQSSEGSAVTFLDAGTMMFVQGTSIAPAVAPGSTSSSPDPVRDHVAQVAGADIFLITRMAAMPGNFSAGGFESAPVANAIRSVRWLTLAARSEGESLRVSLEGDCATGADARQLQSSLETMRVFAEAALEKQHRTDQSGHAQMLWVSLLKTADITQSAERVRILLELPPEVWDYAAPNAAQ